MKSTCERVLDELVEGRTCDREIAMALKITRRTVRRHIRDLRIAARYSPPPLVHRRGRALREELGARARARRAEIAENIAAHEKRARERRGE